MNIENAVGMANSEELDQIVPLLQAVLSVSTLFALLVREFRNFVVLLKFSKCLKNCNHVKEYLCEFVTIACSKHINFGVNKSCRMTA